MNPGRVLVAAGRALRRFGYSLTVYPFLWSTAPEYRLAGREVPAARRRLKEMSAAPRPLPRPLVLLHGWLDLPLRMSRMAGFVHRCATNAGDMLTQRLLAHVPLLLHAAPKRVCVIGYGSGVTAGSALTHPIERLEAVEISPGVVEASTFFEKENGNALADERLHLFVTDARNHLLLTDGTYDVIISEPSNPWMAGVSQLFTVDFFELARTRLTAEGLFCQWAHIYNMAEDDLKTIAGVSFDHKQETPGLGAEIKDNRDWYNQYIGKKIYDESGNFTSVNAIKGGAKDANHEIDGISGATITADGVNDMMEVGLKLYESYFNKLKQS